MTLQFPPSLADLRILELAGPPKLLALNAARIIGVALDLLLTASHASDSQSLPRLSSLGHTPVSIDGLSINDTLTMAPIVVEVAESLPWNLCCPQKSRKKMRSGPDLGADSIL